MRPDAARCGQMRPDAARCGQMRPDAATSQLRQARILCELTPDTYRESGSMIHVCSLARLQETVDLTGARHVVSLIGDEGRLARPSTIPPENHLWLRLHDISEPLDGYIAPAEEHVADLLKFVREW